MGHLMFFFFNDTATTEIYTLSLHDALPILSKTLPIVERPPQIRRATFFHKGTSPHPNVSSFILQTLSQDRKSTRLNSSHANISYAVFCLKKKYLLSHLLLYSYPFAVIVYLP